MTPRRWLVAMAIAGLAIFALSFVNLWFFHDREVRGEGYRFVQVTLSAWRGPGFGLLTLGAIVAGITAVAASASALRVVRLPGWLLLVGSLVVLAIIVASLWPISRHGFASDVSIHPAPLLLLGVALALVMSVAGLVLAPPSAALGAATLAVLLIGIAGGAAGRSWMLQAASNDNRFWSEGSYTRPASGDLPAETLTIDGDRVTIGERWGGSWESSGWSASIEDDPACPDSRGTYHVHDAGDENLRFVKIVDTCRNGERAADLETGIWMRDS